MTPTFTYNSESDHPAEGYPIDQGTLIEGGPGAPSGSDRHALVVNKNLCKLYEVYNLQNFTNGQTPQAGSGAVWDLGSNAMRPAGWTSADAAGLPITPLLLRPDEILAGSVAHAIRFTAHCTNSYIWPASHVAGLCPAGYPALGARVRLRASFNISGFSPSTKVVLRAFQRYGLILADNGADWFFQGTTDDWWGTATGSAVVGELKTIPAAQFDVVDESSLQVAAGSYRASRAAALPQDRLHFGLSNQPTDLGWMTGSGVPWRYRYQYLAGGVNTGTGWETWNSPAGAFATNYMNASSGAGYIPVFSYYELLQSTPSTGANESDRDYGNLNNASTMAAYYANFKLLMQTAGSFGKPVVVHVEPDLWGYLEQRAAGGDASTVGASVAGSGFAEAAGLPNTVQGFAWALLKLRDTYGPNAILAIHASAWGSGIDIATSTSASVNAVTEADKTAAFLNSAGITSNPYGTTWDLVFNDVDDHDAGWWEQQGADNANFTHWWDPSNTKFPNFSRYLAWVGELHAKTARPQVVWQVPVGNQYFLTMNNTCGHYQDNVAPYFIAHAGDLFNAGLVAVMFGPGNSCQTSNDDARQDGITNNGGVATTDVLGGCSACNTHQSAWADDDGGYLRIFVGNYYAGLAACSQVNVTPSPAPPQQPGPQVMLSAVATGCTGPLFEFWVRTPAGAWSLAQGYSSQPTYAWNTAGKVAGTYRFSVWARDGSSPGVGGTPPNTYDAFSAFDYSLTSSSRSGMSASTVPATSAAISTQVTVTGSASGCPNARYAFYLLPPGGTWSLVQPYSANPAFTWNTAGKAAGSYRFSVWARDAASGASYDAFSAFQYSLTVAACTGMSVNVSPASSAARGATVTITGGASGCPNPQYELWYLPPGGTWALARGYAGGTFLWSTGGSPAGSYRFSVWARDTSSAGANGTPPYTYDSFSPIQYQLT